MAKAGLLILTQPLSHLHSLILPIIKQASVVVSDTLYVFLQPALQNQQLSKSTFLYPLGFTKELQSFVKEFYLNSSRLCHNLDIRILLSHISSNPSAHIAVPYSLKKEVSVLLSDSVKFQDSWMQGKNSLTDILKTSFSNIKSDLSFSLLSIGSAESSSSSESEVLELLQTYPNVVLGGTFDQLHTGHKVLLTESCLRCDKKLTVGITDGERNKKKVLWELMEPYEVRWQKVDNFVKEVKPNIVLEAVKIFDPFGPTITDPDLQCIVVSDETKAGGASVNEERIKRGFSSLDMVTIELIEDSCHAEDEESKISSSSYRKRLLGTLLTQVPVKQHLDKCPYRLAITGGIASGKSNVCSELEKLGAKIVNCDLLGHKAYAKGMPAYHKIIQEFGNSVLGEDEEIARPKLGQIVFNDKSKLEKLNSIVWPAIRQLAEEEISGYKKAGAKVVVLEAAVLLEAGWDDMVHEVWTTFVSAEEAIRRLITRNKFNKEDAQKRLDSQISNVDRIARSNVAICPEWEFEVTRKQVEKAWSLLQKRITQA
ncbi:bifunctional coenzyme A synthase [Biomphalaria glabrata]|uniref:Bifunctional coenzyme A synthase n=1 Tax=Biomphalaria glabrata TaxID=6526 RepID=A0A9W2Z6S8_BIOGL|nr:bifunctional coenzyme A synthase-like [Biomphalaria glabrata]XP_055870685.1 bifunctional coenzyme A synthase-like [Biomphalaria glabrata]XP_055870690.1 bifunctional coenzyme A synthase-like [Biomphalaria glabrata]XP_055870699.1 bifunctional coenzyme A synthase-like [Biomphalaria glabrata]KAI8768553.1 bifunctional coenzyme A synthase-like [Biomphalaria glabrata]KAI8777736.1 bifunctional coenzyme A synthase [Biomphalaria glabrata]